MSEVDLANPAANTSGGFKRVKRMVSHVHGDTLDAYGRELFDASSSPLELEFYAVNSPFILSELFRYGTGGKIEWIEIDGMLVSPTPLNLQGKTSTTTISDHKNILFPFHTLFADTVIEKSLRMRISGTAVFISFTDVEV
ncbi:hypothetical protein [Vibrio rotiferianus]|uniref:hypothetical protein n=1 Tax=Vibrio rotiferianus TaxID=190895 RepID=UPI003980B33A